MMSGCYIIAIKPQVTAAAAAWIFNQCSLSIKRTLSLLYFGTKQRQYSIQIQTYSNDISDGLKRTEL